MLSVTVDVRAFIYVAARSIFSSTRWGTKSARPMPFAFPCVSDGEVEDHDLADDRSPRGKRCRVPPRDVRIHAVPADVLADFLDDQHVNVLDGQPRHEAARSLQQRRLAVEERLGRHDGDLHRDIVGVLHRRHAEEQRRLRAHDLPSFKETRREVAESRGVHRVRAPLLAHADHRHFDQAALDPSSKRGVRLDASDDDRRPGLIGAPVPVRRREPSAR